MGTAGRSRPRERQREGLRCVTVELRKTEIDVLVQKGLLKTDARSDTRAVREALYQYFDSTLNSLTRNNQLAPLSAIEEQKKP
jgi:hypothetical protein